MYVGLLPKNSIQKFPAFSDAARRKQTVIGQTSNPQDPCFIHPKICWRKFKNMRKYFKKIHGESLDRGQDPIKKIISTFTAINKRWPLEVVKLFVNVRFFSRLKNLMYPCREIVKNMSEHWNKLLNLCFRIML